MIERLYAFCYPSGQPLLKGWIPIEICLSVAKYQASLGAFLTMGLTPDHLPMQKKQKGAEVIDIWTNDSPIAISRRQWVPPRPAVLSGEGCSMLS